MFTAAFCQQFIKEYDDDDDDDDGNMQPKVEFNEYSNSKKLLE